MTPLMRPKDLLLAGLVTTGICASVGLGVERWRFGSSDIAALARVERDVRTQIEARVDALQALTNGILGEPSLVAAARGDEPSIRVLFDAMARAVSADPPTSDVAVTVYGLQGVPVAWAGRPAEFTPDRLSGPRTLLATPGPSGLRLIEIAPVMTGADPPVRSATIVSERSLSTSPSPQGEPGSYAFMSRLAPATLHTRDPGTARAPDRFAIDGPDGTPLLDISVSRSDLASARQRWVGRWMSALLAMLALTAMLPVPRWLAERRAATRAVQYLPIATRLAAAALAAAGLAWLSNPGRWLAADAAASTGYTAATVQPVIRSSYDMLIAAALLVFLAGLAYDAIERVRIDRRRRRRSPAASWSAFLAGQGMAGTLLAAWLFAHGWFFGMVIEAGAIDLRRLSVTPWNPARLALLIGLLTMHAGVLWVGVLFCVQAGGPWRFSRRHWGWVLIQIGGWMIPALLLAAWLGLADGGPSALGLALSCIACAAVAWARRPLMGWYRHASQASRVLAAFLPVLVPALLLYPHVEQLAERSKRDLIESQLAPQAEEHATRLQSALARTMNQIDSLPATDEWASALDPRARPAASDLAFLIWRQTDLARFRLTSALELYGRAGSLVSRFSMNLPEAPSAESLTPPPTASCAWIVMADASPFGSEERRLFHAERSLCTADGEVVGAVRVHAQVDYGTLPFISSKSPYFDLFQTGPGPFDESAPSRDVELVIYGWGRRPTYASGTGTWPLDEALFERLGASRDRFWTTIARDGTPYAVYFTNDRAGIYALGYPITGTLEQVVELAEIATLAGLAYLLFLGASALVNAMSGLPPTSGRTLWREIRASFSRRLFLAFVATSVVPLLILAIVMRGYFANRLRLDVEAEAERTAAVVQRVIEEALALDDGPDVPASISDEAMVWIGKVIGQDVNIFEGPRLLATNQRDLFASGLLPTRTPPEVYRAIALQRRVRFVGEDVLGAVRYMLVATPVRLGSRSAILTVPHALRQQEIEAEIDELDRRVYLAALFFSFLGAALGLSMAERIADPVRRLTRATQRIARGEFDAALATRSVDELQRLVLAFNRMAGDLKKQRDRLERTHRLEAWADMARQVAHEIKNPLTPIQLSAEHLRRVHADGGEPLGPLVNNCVDSILTQVRLLRQIAGEFSSFASSPTPQPTRVAIGGLLREVTDPYRPGVESRVTITTAVSDDLPSAFIDRTLVGRVLTNLIENALHSITGTGTLQLIADHTDGRVRVQVVDSGMGMDEADARRVFEPYFSTKATGTGLGLTIAKRNIEAMGGTIALVSRKGQGTTVTLLLPTSPPAATASPDGGERPPR